MFDPIRMFPGKSVEGFAFFCDYVLAVSESLHGRKVFACDELQKLTDVRKEPEECLCILEVGRRLEIDVFAISQSPNRIHNAIRNQLTRVYTFRQHDKNALTFIAENGFDENAVRTLAKHRYLWRDLETGETGEG